MAVQASVTLGMPVYNGQRYLRAALDSVIEQDVDDLEILISDNGSTDDTAQICQHYASADSRIRYVRHAENLGGVPNLNYVIQEARAPWFKWAFYDDVLRPGYVARCLEAIRSKGSGVVGAHTQVQVIDESGEVVEDRDDFAIGADASAPHQRLANVYRKLANQLQFGIMSTDSLRRAGGHGSYYAADMTLLTSVLMEGPMVQVEEPLLWLRKHPAQFGNDRFSEMRFYAKPGQSGKYFPWIWLNAQMVRTIVSSGQNLSVTERGRCLDALLREWTTRQWRGIAGDLKFLPKTIRAIQDLQRQA